MDVILHYDTGHPTRLVKHNRLAAQIERDGPPMRIEGWTLHWGHAVGHYASAWHYHLKSPFLGEKRQLVRVSVSPAIDWIAERATRLAPGA